MPVTSNLYRSIKVHVRDVYGSLFIHKKYVKYLKNYGVFSEKIQVTVYAKEQSSLADIKILVTVMISIVFCLMTFNEFVMYKSVQLFIMVTSPSWGDRSLQCT